MSKRSFADFSAGGPESLSQIIEHADALLKAANALKQDLEGLRGDREPDDKVLAVLSRHNKGILNGTQALVEDETKAYSQETSGSHKSQKLEDAHSSANKLPAALPVPPPAALTAWTLEDITKTNLPPLPPVLNPTLEKAALTHSGMVAQRGDMHYERLEWIGDAYLYLMSSAYISQTFPNLTPGRSSQLRERLVKNETLSEFTVQYGINQRTSFPAEFDLKGRIGGSQASEKQKRKVLGDVFEAYVAAAILGDAAGLARVAAWLKALWSKTLEDEIRREHRPRPTFSHVPGLEDNGDTLNNGQGVPPKVLLTRAIGTKGVKISYRDIGEPKKEKNSGLPWYTVGAYYDGLGETDVLLGFGSALSKKEAGANAAENALGNKKTMKRLVKKKEDFVGMSV
ncbi:Uu.00g067970.m01.CDS01 [Anthostomella pinea]|uniref:Uu.00g067970.m01.CDS01 n=1 Tax=Anthostomella pinea TaxID=933095 RepID=A0AAI8VU83_9PEZI|nr:Uu.00g067970.m01.CDS01 [Anthostomella pinea]